MFGGHDPSGTRGCNQDGLAGRIHSTDTAAACLPIEEPESSAGRHLFRFVPGHSGPCLVCAQPLCSSRRSICFSLEQAGGCDAVAGQLDHQLPGFSLRAAAGSSTRAMRATQASTTPPASGWRPGSLRSSPPPGTDHTLPPGSAARRDLLDHARDGVGAGVHTAAGSAGKLGATVSFAAAISSMCMSPLGRKQTFDPQPESRRPLAQTQGPWCPVANAPPRGWPSVSWRTAPASVGICWAKQRPGTVCQPPITARPHSPAAGPALA